MPTKREREYYRMGFSDGYKSADIYNEGYDIEGGLTRRFGTEPFTPLGGRQVKPRRRRPQKPKKKRTLTAWQKFVRTNSKKNEFRLRGGKVNLKKLGVAYRKKTGKRKGKK